jgi:hypothetical protein
LYAVANPLGTEICVAGSDECVRFYHIWGDGQGGREDKEDKGEMDGVIDPRLQMLDRRRRFRTGLSVIR